MTGPSVAASRAQLRPACAPRGRLLRAAGPRLPGRTSFRSPFPSLPRHSPSAPVPEPLRLTTHRHAPRPRASLPPKAPQPRSPLSAPPAPSAPRPRASPAPGRCLDRRRVGDTGLEKLQESLQLARHVTECAGSHSRLPQPQPVSGPALPTPARPRARASSPAPAPPAPFLLRPQSRPAMVQPPAGRQDRRRAAGWGTGAEDAIRSRRPEGGSQGPIMMMMMMMMVMMMMMMMMRQK